jgi:asparagine synthase (glutamine-hydrolysing)
MSAIFGILRFDGGDASARDLERMGNVLAHRGPDGRKYVAQGAIGLGHCLMRVNNEDLFEAQPLLDREAGLALVADCRIDNREELAAAFSLSTADIRDMPDGAFILRAYKTWGEDCAAHLLGDFAFALWDGRAGRLLLGRDHMGQRYVHYHRAEDFFVFATEIKALWAFPGVPRTLSETALGKYLLLDRSEANEGTLYTGIGGIPGGSVGQIGTDGSFRLTPYWAPCADPVHEGRDEAYYIATYRRILNEAVACRLRRVSRTPALCLSGGFDSSAIAALAGPVVRSQGRKLLAVASVMPEGYRGPGHDARPMVDCCKRDMPHLDVRYFTREGLTPWSGFDAMAEVADDLVRPLNYVACGMFRLAAQEGARLMMDGHGGDYTINPRGNHALAYFLRSGQLRRFWVELGLDSKMSGGSLWRTIWARVVRPLLPSRLRGIRSALHRGFAPFWTDRAVTPAFARALIESGAIAEADLGGSPRDKTQMRAQSQRSLRRIGSSASPHLAVLAAAAGLDLTRPFHDKRLVEFAMAIPESLYLRQGRSRYLACRALADLYPSEFQTRGRYNDDRVADLDAVLRRSGAALVAEADRLGADGRLAKYIDFTALRRRLWADEPWRPRKAFALRALLAARYIERFQRGNTRP